MEANGWIWAGLGIVLGVVLLGLAGWGMGLLARGRAGRRRRRVRPGLSPVQESQGAPPGAAATRAPQQQHDRRGGER